jgi:osmotically-inducible protein OsmY
MIDRKLFPVLLGVFLLLSWAACSRSDREKAHEDAEKARSRARQLGRELREKTDQIASQVQTNSTADAREKLRRGEQDLKKAGAQASVKLDRAAQIARVKARLVNDLGVSTVTNISVSTEGDDVILTGHVASADQKQRAEKAALAIPGVRHVRNELSVQP